MKPNAPPDDHESGGDLNTHAARAGEIGTLASSLARARARLVDVAARPNAIREIGELLLKWGRDQEAARFLAGIADIAEHDAHLAFMLGWASFACGKYKDAERFAVLALSKDLGNPEHWLLCAEAAWAQGELAKAAEFLDRMLSSFPDNQNALMRLGQLHLSAGNFREAIAFCNKVIAIDASMSTPFATRARAHNLLGEHVEADASYQTAVALDVREISGGRNSFIGYGNFLRETGRSKAAVELFLKWLPERPSYAGSGDLALARLTAGQLGDAWEGYEFRWINKALAAYRTTFSKPPWQGQDLSGKTILLRDEQGVGDCIQFIRYAYHLRRLGAIVCMQARDSWRSLAAQVIAVDHFLKPEDQLPPFDYYTHLLSLPRLFGTSLESVPADVPYIEAKVEWVQRWAGRVASRSGLKVGLVWAGNPSHTNDANRSLNLLQLLPLLGTAGATFFALQKGARSEQAAEYTGDNWVNLGPEIEDFTDTAGIIANLDLVICVDTSVAHLAGAMAKPVWLLLPKPADFRWMEDREDSPWYPTMKLFRQKERGDWKEVIGRLKGALAQQVESGPAPRWVGKPMEPLKPAYPSQWLAGVTKLPGHRPGMSAVAETRVGMVQYLPDEPVIGDAIAWYGEYMQPHIDLLSTLVAPGSTVMEVDAGIGLHALALAGMVGPQGHVMLYESDPVKRQILEQNLEVHGVRHATIMRRQIGRISEAESEPTSNAGKPMRETLDDLQLERLDWLKINGARRALDVLSRGEETVWRLRPKLVVASIDADDAALAELRQRLQDFGYQVFINNGLIFEANNFNTREFDIFDGASVAGMLAVPEEESNGISHFGWPKLER